MDAEITHLAEQRAMQMVHRYQALSVEVDARTSAETAETPAALLPWRLQSACTLTYRRSGPLHASVSSCVTGVLLRVALHRRLAELSFRGVDFWQLPRKVMRNICSSRQV